MAKLMMLSRLKNLFHWNGYCIENCLMQKRFWKSMVKSSNAAKYKIRWGWLNFDSSFQQKLLAVKTFTVIDVCLHTHTKYHYIINDDTLKEYIKFPSSEPALLGILGLKGIQPFFLFWLLLWYYYALDWILYDSKFVKNFK